MERIEQIRITDAVNFRKMFGGPFMKFWKLKEYCDPNKPALFLCLYRDSDLVAIKNHKAPFIMLWGGGDQNIKNYNQINARPNFLGSPTYREPVINTFKKLRYPYRRLVLPFKSYDRFKPVPLGDKIYVYKGWRVDRQRYFKWNQFIKPLMGVFGQDRFIYAQGKSIDWLHENIYKKVFCLC